MPGAVVAIARDGRLVHYKAYGSSTRRTNEPMPLDAIFQLASMTKVMVAVGALTLNEEGRLPLKSRAGRVLSGVREDEGRRASRRRRDHDRAREAPIFIHDLYRHTSGITYGGRGSTPVHKLYPGGLCGAPRSQYTGEEFIAKLASLPLLYQPGTVWDYGFSTDVLGLVVEKVSGKRLGDYLKEAVWDKVKMPDTTFEVPEAKRARIARPLAEGSAHRQAAEHRERSTSRRSSTAAARAPSPPSATTCASARCCWTAAASTASGCSARRRSCR